MEDYKEKYEHALENLKKIKAANKDNKSLVNFIEYEYPELKESEDERIRKEIIAYIRYERKSTKEEIENRFIPWLEEQGEKDKESYETAEKEKREFVENRFIKCYADFQDFKEGKTYWLEYIGNDRYNVRSDNLLGKTYHITPCQLYTVFKKQTWLEKQGVQKPVDKVEQEKDAELTDFESALFSAFSDAWQEYLSGKEVNVAKWAREHSAELLEAAKVQKPAWSEEDEDNYVTALWHIKKSSGREGSVYNWLKSLKERMKGE